MWRQERSQSIKALVKPQKDFSNSVLNPQCDEVETASDCVSAIDLVENEVCVKSKWIDHYEQLSAAGLQLVASFGSSQKCFS